jgi:hypothetical protein
MRSERSTPSVKLVAMSDERATDVGNVTDDDKTDAGAAEANSERSTGRHAYHRKRRFCALF